MKDKPTFTETVLDASRPRVIRTREDGTVEELAEEAEAAPVAGRRRGAQKEVSDADPT